VCGSLKLHNVSLFNISKDRPIELKSDCGQESAYIKTKDYKTFSMEIPCFACQDTHVFKYTLKQLLKGNIVTPCIETGMEICFIGDNENINELIDKYERDQEVMEKLDFYGYFENFDIMIQCLNRVRQLTSEGKIKCDCGNGEIKTETFSDRIELRCLDCDSIQMIYAENEEDLGYLIRRESITMHKHGFVCIDAINQNIDSTKKQY